MWYPADVGSTLAACQQHHPELVVGASCTGFAVLAADRAGLPATLWWRAQTRDRLLAMGTGGVLTLFSLLDNGAMLRTGPVTDGIAASWPLGGAYVADTDRTLPAMLAAHDDLLGRCVADEAPPHPLGDDGDIWLVRRRWHDLCESHRRASTLDPRGADIPEVPGLPDVVSVYLEAEARLYAAREAFVRARAFCRTPVPALRARPRVPGPPGAQMPWAHWGDALDDPQHGDAREQLRPHIDAVVDVRLRRAGRRLAEADRTRLIDVLVELALAAGQGRPLHAPRAEVDRCFADLHLPATR
jgi:hypothetical protein